MGLDGISINQLRITPELNSSELNSTVALPGEVRTVDGLSNGQRVNPDKENEDNENFNQADDEENEEENKEENETDEPVTKFDLSDTNKFVIKLDEKTDRITISEKASGNIVQTIDAEELLKFVQYAPNSYGSIINKKL